MTVLINAHCMNRRRATMAERINDENDFFRDLWYKSWGKVKG